MDRMQGWNIEYGFHWGPVDIERGFSDDKKGWVTLLLKTKKYPHGLQIYVTKTGKVRVYSNEGEWKLEHEQKRPHQPPPA